MVEEDPPTFAASVDADELPPGYHEGTSSRRRTPALPLALTEHVYTLGAEKKQQPWAFLKVNSRTKKPTKLPLFLQGDKITGTVELDLEKTEHIQAVTLQVRGETWSGPVSWTPELENTVPFWTRKTTLWSTSMGDPGTDGSVDGSPKLKGKYVWPFSISLPSKVTHSNNSEDPVEFALPPSFSERNSPIYVDYKIIVTFSRGRLRLDHTLLTSFLYLPLSRPKKSSILRRLAYREKWSPPGPRDDPEGWEVLEPISMVGKLFDAREVEVACMFALAKPLCYTRGTFIPFALSITCSDSLALDLFAARGSLTIRLMRSLHVKADPTSRPKRAESDVPACVSTGVYWASSEDASAPETRKIEGEIPLKADLKPSFEFPLLVVKYHISFALTAPGFSSPRAGDDAEFTFSREVMIATDPAPGPTPRSRARHARRGGSSSQLGTAMTR